mmetsp:Transcript_50456/g.158893  ORF Transcript_50456/g.158893 Transcript_50456/m.158893 type:complete len:507 (+) Transcript_50456:492-2012(+)
MDKSPPPIKRAVLVENKKFTHDMFVKEGFEHLRPATASFPRTYEPSLANRIMTRLNVTSQDGVVLKLCNRSRGAGIIVVPGNESELDIKLKQLLSPPPDLDGLPRIITKVMNGPNPEDMQLEQCLHWWTNECPVFVVEKLCRSIPVAKQPDSDEKFDGTMRVAFALHRKQGVNKLAHMSVEPEAIKPFEIDWLGGDWKLPKQATVREGASSASELHDQIVSSFNSVDKRTATVPQEDLDEVYEALTPALPVIFHTGALSVTMIHSLYKGDPLFCAFALARVAATMRAQDMVKARQVYDMAKRKAASDSADLGSLAARSVLSYIDRNEGVCDAMVGEWDQAGVKFLKSLERHPTNATSHYLEGCRHEARGELSPAVVRFQMSIGLDPDFKAPYLALGNCFLRIRKFDEAIATSAACLRRNPDAPQAQFVIGQAIYHIMCSRSRPQGEEAREMCAKAAAALQIARDRMPSSWTAADGQMLECLLSFEALGNGCAELPMHIWKVSGWRP